MKTKVLPIILLLSALLLLAALFLPGGRPPDQNPKLPWKILVDVAGNSTVFDLTLGKSNLDQARAVFGIEGKLNLFRSPDNDLTIEAYFERLYLSGIKADIVLTLAVDPAEAETIYQRGIRVSNLGDGTEKVTLSQDDAIVVAQSPIAHLTYIPVANLDAELIQKRFGEPQERIAEASGIVHWLYPDKGLDIALNPEAKEVLQYVSPKDFANLTAPLRAEINIQRQ